MTRFGILAAAAIAAFSVQGSAAVADDWVATKLRGLVLTQSEGQMATNGHGNVLHVGGEGLLPAVLDENGKAI